MSIAHGSKKYYYDFYENAIRTRMPTGPKGLVEEVAFLRRFNTPVDGVEARIGLHICYGKPSWEGSYQYLFPAILEARVHQLTPEFARRREDDVRLFQNYQPPFTLGLGVIDVKSHEGEAPGIVAERIRQALRFVAPERLAVNPDCGRDARPD